MYIYIFIPLCDVQNTRCARFALLSSLWEHNGILFIRTSASRFAQFPLGTLFVVFLFLFFINNVNYFRTLVSIVSFINNELQHRHNQ